MIYDKVLEETLAELLGKWENLQPFAQRIIDSYMRRIAAKGSIYLHSGGKPEEIKELLLQEYQDGVDTLVEAFQNSSELKDSLYKKSYQRLKALGEEEDKDYSDLLTEIYEDETSLNEIFVRLVEEEEGVEITSAKQLQELTGIEELYPEMNLPKEERKKKTTKREAQAEAYRQIEDTFIKAMSYRYSKTLEDMLEAGAKYKDLLQIKPQDFNLPETWSGVLTTNQHTAILWAINLQFLLGEIGGLMTLPSLRAVAEELEAPYSVIMEAYELTIKEPKQVRDINSKMRSLERRLKEDVKKYINNQPEKWKKERLLLPKKGWSQDNIDWVFSSMVEHYVSAFKAIFFNEIMPDKAEDNELSKLMGGIVKANKDTIYNEFGKYIEEARQIYSLPIKYGTNRD